MNEMNWAPTTYNQRFEELKERHNAVLLWNNTAKSWCLYGEQDGLVFETREHFAESREQAENDAADYLEEYNAE